MRPDRAAAPDFTLASCPERFVSDGGGLFEIRKHGRFSSGVPSAPVFMSV